MRAFIFTFLGWQFFIFWQGSSFWACKEPELCKCFRGCSVLDEHGSVGCHKPLLVVPNLKVFWGPRLILQQVASAKEKVAYESAKTYTDPWKGHVIGTKQGAVKGMYGLLGISLNVLKSSYQATITSKSKTLNAVGTCDLAKCIAFCKQQCESGCSMLEKSDEAFLGTISWTKDMCDVDGSKQLMTTQCNEMVATAESCDANCDRAIGVYPLLWSTSVFASHLLL